MVGFVQGTAIEGVKAEVGEDIIKNQAFPELENFPSSFTDSLESLLDFDAWLMEGSGVNKAGVGGNPVDFDSFTDELGSIKKEFEVFGDEMCQKDETVGDLGVKVESLWDLEQENGEIGVVEKCSEIVTVEGAVAGEGSEKKLGDLGFLIEEQLGKVSLDGVAIVSSVKCESSGGELGVGDGSKSGEMATGVCDSLKSDVADGVAAGASDLVGVTGNENKGDGDGDGDGDESGSDEESSEDESSSDSSSSSSSSSSDDEDSEDLSGQKKGKNKDGSVGEETEIEDGEIMLSDAEMAAWSDNEDDDVGGGGGPIKSKNELKDLPPVPPVCVTLKPDHQTFPVGTVLSIMPPQVIVEGVEKHNPLNEGSVLWITESRTPLGIVDEIFGPVKNPYYIVRYNSEKEVPTGIEQGTLISFVADYAGHVLNDKSIYKKGYDASNENDEELSEEAEFSDDEKEAEYRRMQKMKKRGTSESKPGNKKKDKRQLKNQMGDWNNNRDPAAQAPQGGGRLPVITEGQQFVPPVGTPLNQENRPCPSGPRQGFAGDQAAIPPFPHRPQAPGFSAPNGAPGFPVSNGAPGFPASNGAPGFPASNGGPGFPAPNGSWNNGFPQHQQQNVNLLSGLPPNGMLWMQQTLPYLYQTPLQNGASFQQQMGMIPGMPSNFNPMTGQPNFGGTLPPWPMDQNASQFGMNQNAVNPMQFGMNQNQNAVNPSQFGVNQNAVNPSQFGMNQNAVNPSQFGMNQNAVNPSQFGMNQNAPNPSQGALPPNGGGEQAVQSQGSQDSRNMQQPPPAFSFNGGRGSRGGGGGGRRGNHRGRGHFGGGRGRRS